MEYEQPRMEAVASIATEEFIHDVCSVIEPANYDRAMPYIDFLKRSIPDFFKIGSLVESMLRYVTATGKDEISFKKGFMNCIFCGDHGVSAEGVSAYPQETTLEMTANYVISHGAAANAFSNFLHAGLIVVDMGIKGDTDNLPSLLHMKIAQGTENSAQGPAMTRKQAMMSLVCGIVLGREMAKAGWEVFLPGEMGISNTTASAALTAVFCNLPPEEVTGRGTNISDARLQKKIAVVRQILEVNRPDAADPIGVLSKVGGFELGAIAGLILGAATEKKMVILDGFNTGAAALIAQALCPDAMDYVLTSHMGSEKGHAHILQKLERRPLMNLDIKLGEAIGSSLTAKMLRNVMSAAMMVCRWLPPLNKSLKLMEHYRISPKEVKLTDKTFDFYVNTMPSLDKEAMAKCQMRLDNLAKPADSLGTMEKIAVQLSGILGDELPDTDLNTGLFLIGMDEEMPSKNSSKKYGESASAGVKADNGGAAADTADKNDTDSAKANTNGAAADSADKKDTDSAKADNSGMTADTANVKAGTKGGTSAGKTGKKMRMYTVPQKRFLFTLCLHCQVPPHLGHLTMEHTPADAFEFGRQRGEELSLQIEVLGLGMMDKDLEYTQRLADELVDEKDNLRYNATDFLSHLNHKQQLFASAVLGAMVAAAHNRSLVVLDDAATVAIARYAVAMLPELKDFLLPVQPNLYTLRTDCPGLAAIAGIDTVLASLHVLNDMKTFTETQVSVANDGAGKGRQVR